MHLPDNTLIQGGKYKIVRFISSGGFGCTYEAEHVMLKKTVAIKEFFVKDFCNRDESSSMVSVGTMSKVGLVDKLRQKFIMEAQSVSSLKHPNIVNVTDVFEENGTAYYVMDFIDGPSLNDVVKSEGKIEESRAVSYIRPVAEALEYVHSHNRLHLDIKPGNIMIDRDGNAILIDFGASKQYDEVDGENTSTLLGKTPGYAPLEQMGNDVVKFLPSTDIYALGATFYKLLTGITPPSATLLASGETLEDFPSTVSDSARHAIMMAMQTNKKKRPQSIGEFMNILQSGASGKSGAAAISVEDERTFLNEEVANDKSKEDIVKSATGAPKGKTERGKKTTPAPRKNADTRKETSSQSIKLDTRTSSSTSNPDGEKKKMYVWFGIIAVSLVVIIAVFIGSLSGSRKTETIPEPVVPAAPAAQPDSTRVVTPVQTAPKETADDGSNAKINVPTLAMTVGENYTLKVSNFKGTVVWRSSDSKIATVSNGKVSAKADGKATISAICGNKTLKTVITVDLPSIYEFVENKEDEPDDEPIPFQLVEQKPSFNGGDANKFTEWVNQQLVYPEIAIENGVQGRVTLQFTVNTDGTVSGVKVLRGVDPVLDREAVRVVSMSPRWTPGRQKGRAVKVTYTFPVIFGLRDPSN